MLTSSISFFVCKENHRLCRWFCRSFSGAEKINPLL